METSYMINNKKINIIHLETVDSTNTYAKHLASQNHPEGTIVIADHQTNGRGRLGRSFFSPKDTGIYMSVILKPDISCDKVLYITTAAAVSVATAIEKLTGSDTKIKWVNDVYMQNKKVCGILTEGHISDTGSSMDYAILGIGINISEPESGFPDDIKNIATAIINGKNTHIKENLIYEILNIFFDFYKNIKAKPHLDDYRKRSLIDGEDINIIRCNKVVDTGTCLGIDDDFSLIVKTSSGISHISSGEVSVRIK